MRLIEVVPPAEEPVTLVRQKLHMRIDHDAEDELISTLISAARQVCESMTSRSFIATTWDLHLDAGDLPYRSLFLPRAPVMSIESITYVGSDGEDVILDPDDYTVRAGTPGGLTLSLPYSNCVIRFVAGYGIDSTYVPESVKVAIKMLAAHLYEHREAVSETNLSPVPFAVEALLSTVDYSRYC